MAQSSAQWKPAGNPGQVISDAAQRGVGLAAEEVLGEAKKIVPHETGVLERSGRADVARNRGGLARASIQFDAPYSAIQHENMHYRHKKGRKAKYLEGPLNSNKNKVLAIVAAALRGSL